MPVIKKLPINKRGKLLFKIAAYDDDINILSREGSRTKDK